MKAAILAEEVLTLMVYGFDLLAMPTFRKWDQSYEGWLYENGFLRRMQWLEAQKFVERRGRRGDWVYRLTKRGRQFSTADRDPQARWQRKWDGCWRMFIFDLPVEQKKARDSLLRWLKRNRFGYLQDSVWISPDPVTEVVQSLKGWEEDAATFTLLESRCAAGFSDSALVAGAWQFSKVNERYDAYLRFANPALRRAAGARLHPRDLFAALREEGQRWSAAFDRDPLLPRVLWPKEYGGEEAWKLRQRLLRTLAVHAAR